MGKKFFKNPNHDNKDIYINDKKTNAYPFAENLSNYI